MILEGIATTGGRNDRRRCFTRSAVDNFDAIGAQLLQHGEGSLALRPDLPRGSNSEHGSTLVPRYGRFEHEAVLSVGVRDLLDVIIRERGGGFDRGLSQGIYCELDDGVHCLWVRG